jgi:WD40 repeat protein
VQVSDDPRVGTELAGYRLEALLGLGGMSVVYVAEDLRLKRRVALKLLAADLAEDDEFRDRFLRESELAASIDHPNIVPIYEAGGTGDVLFIAMRYVEGGDLKRRVRQGPLDPAVAVGILAQVAVALDAAHARGLVHRDVKPSNVLLDTGARPDGSDHAYLADFGLMRRVAEGGRAGDGRRLAGTIDYVAPEQITGSRVDGRADVYALGCVLFECLVGEPPFRQESELAVVFAHLEEEPPSASMRRPELPVALDAVIARALAKEPEQRWDTCTELARAALAVSVDEASRRLADAASRAAAGRSGLSEAEAELAGTVSDLRAAHSQARALAAPPAADAPELCPFKGLASFEASDADVFFGRERLVAELVARLAGAGFLGIVGPSGSGKSSVLRAGLLPALADGVLPGSGGWRRWLLRPGAHPLESLQAVLDDPPAATRLLVAVDQLEELFTACRDEAERAAFAGLLARAATDPGGRVVVVAAVRADFYGRFAAHPALAELLGANHVLVGPMQPSELRRAVELPAERVGLRVEPELVDALVDDVEGEPGALPLLSTALLELWQNRSGRTLTLTAYRDSGGVHGACERLAEGAYARVPEARRPLVRAVMLRLVGSGEGDAAVRRRAPLAELDADVADVVATLADSRLVTVGEGSVEVAHEALLREWPRLREWIAEDAAGRRLRRHLTRTASDWDASGRDPSELYRGARLAAALDWSGGHEVELNELEREFVAASRHASEREARRARRTNRRLRVLLAGVGVLLVAAVAGGILALVQRGEARDAATAQLAQRLGAQAVVEDDLDLALLLARQAVAIDDTPQTRGSLFASLLRAPAAVGIMHGSEDALLWGIDLSPDGRTLVVADFYNGLLFFDARTNEQLGELLPTPAWVESVAYSPDGTTVAAGGDGFVVLVDVRTREIVARGSPRGHAPRLAFTSDGSKLVVLVERTIRVLDAHTLRPSGAWIEPEGWRPSFLHSYYRPPQFGLAPDGRTLVTASDEGELVWWDLVTRRRLRTYSLPAGYHAVAVGRDGRTAAVGIEGGVLFADLQTGAMSGAGIGFAGSPNAVLFAPDGRTVVSANLDSTATRWDVASATPLETLRGHSTPIRQAVFGRDGKRLYTVGDDGTAIAWDLSGEQRVKRTFRFTHDRDFDEAYDAHPGRLSPDGRLIAVGLKGEGVALLDVGELTPTGPPLRDTAGEVKALAFSSDGRTLAATTGMGNTTVWNVASRQRQVGPITMPSGFLVGLAFGPDGTTLASAGSSGVELWDPAAGRRLAAVGAFTGSSGVAMSADGRRLATTKQMSGGARVWDVRTRALLAEVPGGSEADELSVALTGDGRRLAVGGYGTLVRLWDVDSGRLVHEFEPKGAGTPTLDFSGDGRVLAASGFEPVASLWDVASGTQIGPNLTAGRRTGMVDVSDDGRRLLLTLANGEGAVWDIDPRSWSARACALANRTLTREEWGRFLPGRPYEPACAA